MPHTPLSTDQQKAPSLRTTAALRDRDQFVRCVFDRVSIGFALGGVSLWTVGCIVGASVAYHHPVARALSVLWWGTFFGCFGASVGALVALLTERVRARPSQHGNGVARQSTGTDRLSLPDDSGSVRGAEQATRRQDQAQWQNTCQIPDETGLGKTML